MANRTCSIEGCERGGLLRRGWCSPHYQRWLSHGDPMGGGIDRIKGDDEARFWSKIDKSGPLPAWAPFLGPCWLWTGPLTKTGYAHFGVGGRTLAAHRYAYGLSAIPAGLTLDHLCRVRHCVNPAHLEPVTQGENSRRARFADRRSVAA